MYHLGGISGLRLERNKRTQIGLTTSRISPTDVGRAGGAPPPHAWARLFRVCTDTWKHRLQVLKNLRKGAEKWILTLVGYGPWLMTPCLPGIRQPQSFHGKKVANTEGTGRQRVLSPHYMAVKDSGDLEVHGTGTWGFLHSTRMALTAPKSQVSKYLYQFQQIDKTILTIEPLRPLNEFSHEKRGASNTPTRNQQPMSPRNHHRPTHGAVPRGSEPLQKVPMGRGAKRRPVLTYKRSR